MTQGNPPFESESMKDLARQIVKGRLMFDESIKLTKECRDIMSKLLEKDPKKRLGCGVDGV